MLTSGNFRVFDNLFNTVNNQNYQNIDSDNMKISLTAQKCSTELWVY